jgi:hypothetical protein
MLEQTRLEQTWLEQTRLEQTRLEQTRLEQTRLEQTRLGQTMTVPMPLPSLICLTCHKNGRRHQGKKNGKKLCPIGLSLKTVHYILHSRKKGRNKETRSYHWKFIDSFSCYELIA